MQTCGEVCSKMRGGDQCCGQLKTCQASFLWTFLQVVQTKCEWAESPFHNTHTHVHTVAQMHTHTCSHAHTHTLTHTHTHTCSHAHTHTLTHTHTHTCSHAHTHTLTHTHTHMFTRSHTHTRTHTHTHARPWIRRDPISCAFLLSLTEEQVHSVDR